MERNSPLSYLLECSFNVTSQEHGGSEYCPPCDGKPKHITFSLNCSRNFNQGTTPSNLSSPLFPVNLQYSFMLSIQDGCLSLFQYIQDAVSGILQPYFTGTYPG